MANEISLTNNADLRITSVLNQFVYLKLRDQADLRSTCMRLSSTDGQGTLAVKVPQAAWDDVMAAPGEATATLPTALGDDSVTVTAARQTLRYDPTDEFMISNSNTGPQDISNGLAEAYIRRTTDLIGQVIDGFSATAGTTTVDLSVDDIYDALFQLEDLNNDGPFNCALTRKQFGDFRNSLRGEGGPMQWADESREILAAKKMQGYQGSWNGIDFWTSNLLQDDGTDDWGALYTVGAVGLLEVAVNRIQPLIPTNQFLQMSPPGNMMWVEIQRTSESAITKFVGHGFVGAALNDDDRGVTIRSGH